MIIKELCRKKSFKFYYIIMTLIFITILSLLLFYNTVSNKIAKKAEYYVNRELALITEDNITNLSMPKSIIGIYSYNNIQINLKDFEYTIKPYFEYNKINLEKGRKIQNLKEIIAPTQFLIGEKIVINEDIYTVVGTYQDMIINDTLYISLDDWNQYDVEKDKYVLIVDSFENVPRVVDELESKQYYANIFDTRFLKELSLLENLKKLSFLIVTILISLIIFLFYGILKSILEEEKYSIAIFKSVGYKTKQLFFMYLLKQLFLISISYLTSLVIIYISTLILNLIGEMEFMLPFKYSIIIFLIFLFINFVSIILNIKKLDKIQPTIIFRNI